MKHNLIHKEDYFLIIDDSDIKIGDWYLRYNSNISRCTDLQPVYNEASRKHETIILSNGCGDPYERSKDHLKKIIAHLPLNNAALLDGVDLLPQIEDLQDPIILAQKEYREFPNNPKQQAEWNYGKDTNCHRKRKAFIKGYNKALEQFNSVIKWIDDEILLNPHYNESSRFKLGAQTVKIKLESLFNKKIPTHFESKFDQSLTHAPWPKELGSKYDFEIGYPQVLNERKTILNEQGQTVWKGNYIF